MRQAERERQLAARVATLELEKSDKPKAVFDVQARPFQVWRRLHATCSSSGTPTGCCERQDQSRIPASLLGLRKPTTGIVNRVKTANITQVVPEFFAVNLIRGRGLFAGSIMKAQVASLPFTPVSAALVAIINTKLPRVSGRLRRSFKRNDKVRVVCGKSP